MARYTDPVCKLCRRMGEKLFLKGARCFTGKCPLERQKTAKGKTRGLRRKVSEYARQLQEKQKIKYMTGILEGNLRRYLETARRKKGITGEELVRLLACRLDNVVYLLGFAPSKPAARQLVVHGHLLVNGRKVNIPSFQLKQGDQVALAEKSKSILPVKQSLEGSQSKGLPSWLSLDRDTLVGKVETIPERSQVYQEIKEQIIVEVCSR